jgi:DNA-binding IclR family transcriptional regulator
MKTLNKAIDVLECFTNMQENVQLSEIARESGLDKSTVNRIVMTWVKRGYLKQIEKRGKYSLGTKFLDFSRIIKRRSRIRSIAMPHLFKLAQISKESVILSILDGQFAAYNETIPSEFPLGIIPDEGIKVPLYCTGVGKIFLANMTEAEIDNYLNTTKLEPYTAHTITNPDYLKAQIANIAKENIVFETDESFIGISNIAAGIKNAEGKCVAAVGVLGPSARFTQHRMTEVVPHIKKCVSDISSDLGFKE